MSRSTRPSEAGMDQAEPEGRNAGSLAPATLDRALAALAGRGDSVPLIRWLDRELDDVGVPRRLPVGSWGPCLAALAEGRSGRASGWPPAADDQVRGLVLALLRFSRPDGSDLFGPDEAAAGRVAVLRAWADWLDDPAIAAVVGRWFPSRKVRGWSAGSPPLPAFGAPDRALAILRADWLERGDLLAIDHRDERQPCRLELIGQGDRWLGPSWSTGSGGEPSSRARTTYWKTGPDADLAEWTFRTKTARVVRTALLLRGRQMALLADEVTSLDSLAVFRVSLPSGVRPVVHFGSPALGLASGRSGSVRLLPLGLKAVPEPNERGGLIVEGRDLILRQLNGARRSWLPLLVSWGPERNRRPVRWRPLTVSERSRSCPPGVAFAVRVAWGADESLVIYRSLGPPALRTFLGHQTRARFLVGLFTREGNVEPLVKVEG